MGRLDNESTIIGWASLLLCVLIIENKDYSFVKGASFVILVLINAAFFLRVLTRLVRSTMPYKTFEARAVLYFTR